MPEIAIAVHGGAGPDSSFIQENEDAYKAGIKAALEAGYALLEKGASAVEAVEGAVRTLENNYLFNAGKGAALNEDAAVEMCASVMDGYKHQAGAVAIVKNVKNPVSLARAVLENSQHIYLGDTGARKYAEECGIEMQPDDYFITKHAYEQYQEKKAELLKEGKSAGNKMHGTVGAVALDRNGNIAAATSTGGTECNKAGRIGDSSMIGAGTYADNNTCAVSCTGDGEYNIRFVSAFHVAAIVEYKGIALQEACNFLIHDKAKDVDGDMGLIAINTRGEIAMAFNSERMHRGWKSDAQEGSIAIYK